MHMPRDRVLLSAKILYVSYRYLDNLYAMATGRAVVVADTQTDRQT